MIESIWTQRLPLRQAPLAGGAVHAHGARRSDPAHGRFADVALVRCRRRGRVWLHYGFEYEAFRTSGRWYRGLLTEAQARTATAETAGALLEALPWYFAGGSYYEGSVGRSSGPLR